jgi:pyridinium-3,5-bisthiocarboxylic acid mononucleotide nickel chelatase
MSPRSSTAPERGGARLLHLDCFGGATSESLLGALLGVGADPRSVRRAVDALWPGARLRVSRTANGALPLTRVALAVAPATGGWKDLRARLGRARLTGFVRSHALEALGAVARVDPRAAADARAAAGLVGFFAALESLAPARVSASPPALGHGVRVAPHGPEPLPSPATLELLRGIPTVPGEAAGETVTPPAAAALAAVVDEFGALPAMRPRAQGLADGVRAVLGEAAPELARDEVAVLDTHLDDMTPEHLAFLVERLHDAGALDASLAPLVMKKGRPGQSLRVLARPADADRLARLVLADSTALGVRLQRVPRLVLRRGAASVSTEFGPIRVKLSRAPDGAPAVKPEYEACARAARRHGVAIGTVTRAAQRRAEDELL